MSYSNNKITKEDFCKYLQVQRSGKYNMLDLQAEKAVGISHKKYMNIIQNYVEYEIKFKNDN